MNRLTDIIGPAPSELSKEALLARLQTERKRVSLALDPSTYKKTKGKGKGKKGKRKKTAAEQLAALGMTEEEFLAARKEVHAKKEEKE